jgi:hypothetical protein
MMLLDDWLVGKLSDFTFKNRLNTQVRANCATQGVFATFPGSLLIIGKVSIMPSRRVLLNQ